MFTHEIRSMLKRSVFVYPIYNLYKKITSPRRLKKSISESNSLKIVLGASTVYDEGWVPTDIHNLNLLRSEDWKKYFQPNSIDAMLAEHVWEHLTLNEASIALKYCFKYLKHGGYFRIAVPDGYHPNKDYIDYVKVGGTGPGSDDHKVLYTIELLQEMLEDAGFTVHPLEYFNKNGEFTFNEWNTNQGRVHRSMRFDSRNKGSALSYTSIIVDAYKK